jgi:transcriptional regulator with XRE-family HTH domain
MVNGKAKGPRPNLKRHVLVARLRAQGFTLDQIGQRLGISHQAVAQTLRRSGCMRRPACADCGVALVTHGGPLSYPIYCPRCLAAQPKLPFPAQLRSRRLASGLTQAKLAQGVGLNVSTVCKYECGWALPRPRTLARLVKILGTGLRATNE